MEYVLNTKDQTLHIDAHEAYLLRTHTLIHAIRAQMFTHDLGAAGFNRETKEAFAIDRMKRAMPSLAPYIWPVKGEL